MSKIQKELSRIQGEIKANKSQYNSFGKYNYRSVDDILEGYKKVKGETSIILSDTIEAIGDRVYVKATATIYIDGESLSNTAYAREPNQKKGMDEAQVTGATSSYARKYALGGLLALDDTKDADSMNNSQKLPDRAGNPVQFMTSEQRTQIVALAGEKKLTQQDWNNLKVPAVEANGWDMATANKCIDYLKSMK